MRVLCDCDSDRGRTRSRTFEWTYGSNVTVLGSEISATRRMRRGWMALLLALCGALAVVALVIALNSSNPASRSGLGRHYNLVLGMTSGQAISEMGTPVAQGTYPDQPFTVHAYSHCPPGFHSRATTGQSWMVWKLNRVIPTSGPGPAVFEIAYFTDGVDVHDAAFSGPTNGCLPKGV